MVVENRMLSRIFGPKREEVAGGWRRLHDEELRNLYASQSIITVNNSRRMRWAGHVEMGNSYEILLGKPERKRSLRILGVYGKIILEWIVEKCVDWMHLAGCCEHANESSGPIRSGNFLTA
jgi:hypothetical protein